MPKPGKTITAEQAGVLLPGTRVHARYQGPGTVIIPSHRMMRLAHFDDDVAMRRDDGVEIWLGQETLRRL